MSSSVHNQIHCAKLCNIAHTIRRNSVSNPTSPVEIQVQFGNVREGSQGSYLFQEPCTHGLKCDAQGRDNRLVVTLNTQKSQRRVSEDSKVVVHENLPKPSASRRCHTHQRSTNLCLPSPDDEAWIGRCLTYIYLSKSIRSPVGAALTKERNLERTHQKECVNP